MTQTAATGKDRLEGLGTNQPVILFDGVCTLCNRSVRFIFDRENGEALRYASLQSETGKAILREFGLPDGLHSVIFIENGIVYKKSTAALKICQYLRFPWSLGQYFTWVAAVVRDGIYDFIGRNRYNWFGKLDESCALIPPEARKRFV